MWYGDMGHRIAKFDPRVDRRRTANIENLVFLVIILATLILLPYHIYVLLILILLFFLFIRER